MNSENETVHTEDAETKAGKNENQIQRKIAPPSYLEVVVIALLIAAGSLYAYDHFYAPKITSFAIKEYLRDQKNLLTEGKITEDEWKKGLDKLEMLFKEQPDNQIILMNDVVLKHGRETELKLK